jgi:hypothetical protein
MAAALAACTPPADYVVASMGDVVTAAATLASLRQSGVSNAPTVIVTANTTATIVVASSAIVLAWHPVQIETENEPMVLGRGIRVWSSGVAGTSIASAVQVRRLR